MVHTIFNNIRHVQNLRRQYSWVHLEVFSKARHLNDETRGNLLQFDVGRVKALLKQLLDTR